MFNCTAQELMNENRESCHHVTSHKYYFRLSLLLICSVNRAIT